MKLSKEGYGTPAEILDMRVDLVTAMIEYEGFLWDYERTTRAINGWDK